NPYVKITGTDSYSHYTSYFIGKDKSKWVSAARNFKKINYTDLYNGVDLHIYQNEDNLKYDIILHPGSDPKEIVFEYEGPDKIIISENGDLIINTSVGNIVEKSPYAYQNIDGKVVDIGCKYILSGNKLKFKIGKYDNKYDLIIDPDLIFSTFSGSYSNNFGYTATYDAEGYLYSGSTAFGPDYPTTIGAYQIAFNGAHTDMALTKWDLTGSFMIWSTLLGGSNDELPHSIYVNNENELIVYGTSGSLDFPTTTNAFQTSFAGGTSVYTYGLGVDLFNGTDIVVARIGNDGTSLTASTYIGGSGNDGLNVSAILRYNYADEARGEVFVDLENKIYIVSSTNSTDFPVTSGAFQTTYGGGDLDGCVIKLNNDLTTIEWSSYLGGSGDDGSYSLEVDDLNNIYVTGGTFSTNFPTTAGSYQPAFAGGSSDAYITHISENGQSILNSTYYGSVTYDQAFFVEKDNQGYVYILGQTEAPGSTFIFNAGYSVPNSGQFVTKFTPDLSTREFSTVFGKGSGQPDISPTAFLVDVCNKLYISGWGGTINNAPYGHGGNTFNLPVTWDAYQNTTDGSDFYIAVLEDDVSSLVYATFMGSPTSSEHVDGGTSRFSKKGKIYQAVCAGCWGDSGFPTTPSAWSNVNNNSCNLAVFKFDFLLPITIADFPLPLNVCSPYTHNFDNLSLLGTSYLWDFGDGDTSTLFEPTHIFSAPGTYIVSLVVGDTSSCNISDTAIHIINVHTIDINVPNDTVICIGESINITVQSSDPNTQYVFSSYPNFSDTLNSNILIGNYSTTPTTSATIYIHVNGQYCDAMDSINIQVVPVGIDAVPDTIICFNDTTVINITNLIPGDILSYNWASSSSIISGLGTGTILVNPTSSTTYTVTATNQFGCEDIESVTISVDQVTVNLDFLQNVTCFNDCDGQIGILQYGIGPFTYDWSNFEDTQSIINLCPGTYSVTVTDSIGCKNYFSETITEPSLLEAYISDIIHAECDSAQSNVGSATVYPSGGSPGYIYQWSNNQTTSIISNLYAGIYIVTVSDTHGCDTILSVQINDGSPLDINVFGTNVLCYGECTGTASVAVTIPGTPPYDYIWDNGYTLQSVSDLCAGIHTVTVVDAAWCVRIESINTNQPYAIDNNVHADPIVCFGDSTNIYSTVESGGTSPYTYLWNTGITGQILNNVPIGTYYVIVTDANLCKDTVYVNVMQPPILVLDSAVYELACEQACNGRIQVIMNGGASPYYYTWNQGDNTATVTHLCSGNYYVTVTDALGCKTYSDFFVGISDYIPPLDIFADDYEIFIGQSTQLHATDSLQYYYIWEPPTSLNYTTVPHPIANPLVTTTYELRIVDIYGCSNIDTLTIYVKDVICDEPFIYVPNAFTPNGDGQNDILYVHSNIITELYFAIYDRWGEIMFETDDLSNGWDGTYKGELADPAVFVYYMRAVCLDEKTFVKKGNITLIR
ncbi:MAG: PKD domain-containing protein, partial [Bacteroidota bacterium]